MAARYCVCDAPPDCEARGIPTNLRWCRPADDDVSASFLPDAWRPAPGYWALHTEAAKALGVSTTALRQWMFPEKGMLLSEFDPSDRYRHAPYACLPPEWHINSCNGRALIEASAIETYVARHKGRRKRGPRPAALTPRQRTDIHSLRLPDVDISDDTVAMNGKQYARDAFVDEWLIPLADALGVDAKRRERVSLPLDAEIHHPTVTSKRKRGSQ